MYPEEIYMLLKVAFNAVHKGYPFPTAEEFKNAPEKFRAAIGHFTIQLNDYIRESNQEWMKTQKDMYIVEYKANRNRVAFWKLMTLFAVIFGAVSFLCLVLVSQGILVIG